MSQNARITALEQTSVNLNARLLAVSTNAMFYAALGTFVKFGCKVTESSSSPLDMVVRLQGQASGDSAYLNPDASTVPSHPWQYPNIAHCKGGPFHSLDTSATVSTAPSAGTARYDIAYIFAGKESAGFAIAAGTPSAAVLADYTANGLQTAAYGEGSPDVDPVLPAGALPVARIYVAPEVTAIAQADIADLRSYAAFSIANASVISGTINGVPIGGTTPAAGAFTTLSATSGITGTLSTAAQPNITSLGTLTSLTVDNITVNGAAITSDTGAISFDNENLTTTGTLAAGTTTITGSLGVGVAAAQKLHTQVAGGNNYSRFTTTTSGDVRIEFDLSGRYYNWIETEDSTGNIVVAVTNSEQIRLSSTEATFTGALRIDPASGGASLILDSQANEDPRLSFQNNGNTSSYINMDNSAADLSILNTTVATNADIRITTSNGVYTTEFKGNGIVNFPGVITLNGSSTIASVGTGTAELILDNDDTGGKQYNLGSTGTGYGSAGNFIIYDVTDGAERFRIDTNGDATFSGGLQISGGVFNIGAASELTISAGVVTATGSNHSIDTESDSASDDLDTINGGVEGDVLVIHAANSARTVVVKDNVGNLNLAGDFSMDSTADKLTLLYAGSAWNELSRSDNAA